MINRIKKNFINNNRYLFIISSILFGLCFVFEHPHGDDVTIAHIENFNFQLIIDRVLTTVKGSYASFYTGVITGIFNNLPRIYFVIFMSIILFIAQEGMRLLFSKNSNKEKYINVFIVFAVLSYSFVDMQSAGWIVTTCCYLVPAAFSLFALLPIKKFLKNEKIEIWEYLVCTFSIILTANQPQGMALLLICYIGVMLFSIINKRINKYVLLCFIIILVNVYFTLTSNWHMSRVAIETAKRMPMINMFNLINKIDIGLSSSFGWLFFGDNPFIIYTLIVFSLLIFIKYKNLLFRVISIIPELLILIFRKSFLTNMSINAFEIRPEELGSSNYGLFNLDSINKASTYFLFFAMCTILIIIIIELVLLTDNNQQLIILLVLLAAGFGSRFALSFTPNVFASQQRTFIYLDFSIIASCICIYSINVKLLSEKFLKYFNYILCFGSLLSLGYFFAYVYNYGGSSLFDLFR